MTKRTVKNYGPCGIVDPENPTVEVCLFPCVAICLGAWGAGDTPEDACKQMKKAGGSVARYIAYKAPTDKLTCEGGCLTAYPPEGGTFSGTGFDDVEETRYVKGKGYATGKYGQVEWPDAKRKAKA